MIMYYVPRLKFVEKEVKIRPELNVLGSRQADLSENPIVIQDETIDGKHAVLRFNPILNTTELMDLFSHKGTSVDGRRIPTLQWVSLDQGQFVTFGSIKATFLTELDKRCDDLNGQTSENEREGAIPINQINEFSPKTKTTIVPDTDDETQSDLSFEEVTLPETDELDWCKKGTSAKVIPETQEVSQCVQDHNITIPETQEGASVAAKDTCYMESQDLLGDFGLYPIEVPKAAPQLKATEATDGDDEDTDCEEELKENIPKDTKFVIPMIPMQPMVKMLRVGSIYDVETQVQTIYDAETQPDLGAMLPPDVQKIPKKEATDPIYLEDTQDLENPILENTNMNLSQSSQISTPSCEIDLPKEWIKQERKAGELKRKAPVQSLFSESDSDDEPLPLMTEPQMTQSKSPKMRMSSASALRWKQIQILDSPDFFEPEELPSKNVKNVRKNLIKSMSPSVKPEKSPEPDPPVRRSKRKTRKALKKEFDYESSPEVAVQKKRPSRRNKC